MVCNQDEAARAMEIAIEKFHEKDYLGSKKFAERANSLYPELKGLSQLLVNLNIHVSAATVTDGEKDWYHILNVDPLANEDMIKKAYRRAVLNIHPDKNKSVGADGAFRLVSEAWHVLSNREKKAAYDLKRVPKQACPYRSATTTPVLFASNDFGHIFSHKTTRATSPAPAPASAPASAPCSKPAKKTKAQQETRKYRSKKGSQSIPTSFWTVCTHCGMRYEYLRKYVNMDLKCQACKNSFHAAETAPPAAWKKFQKRKSETCPDEKTNKCSSGSNNSQRSSFIPTTANTPNHATSQASCVKSRAEHLKRARKDAKETFLKPMAPQGNDVGAGTHVPEGSMRHPKKKMRKSGKKMPIFGSAGNCESSTGNVMNFESSPGTEASEINRTGSRPASKLRAVSHQEACKMLTHAIKADIGKKFTEWENEATAKSQKSPMDSSSGEANGKMKDRMRKSTNVLKSGANMTPTGKSGKTNTEVQDQDKTHAVDGVATSPAKDNGSLVMSVPDPDFHDFDGDRTQFAFGKEQVWAAYDNDDTMPRLYALIDEVSLKPFKIKFSWLNSKRNAEFGPMEWVASGFYKTSGKFAIGKKQTYMGDHILKSFSHRVNWAKISGQVHIYPQKGEVWAVYRKWSPDWDSDVLDEVVHQYDLVEVIQDYTEQTGVTVAPLVKVPGFKTVFWKNIDPATHMNIPKHEIFRLSHQVSSYLLTEEEFPNSPKGCLEIDPAAVNLELLKVIPEPNSTSSVADPKD